MSGRSVRDRQKAVSAQNKLWHSCSESTTYVDSNRYYIRSFPAFFDDGKVLYFIVTTTVICVYSEFGIYASAFGISNKVFVLSRGNL